MFSVLVLCSLVLAVLTMSMLLLKDASNVIVFAVLYGFFAGGCEFTYVVFLTIMAHRRTLVISFLGQLPLIFVQGDQGVK